MNSKVVGDISEAAVVAALLKAGYNVLMPFGDRNRYDVVIEHDGKFERVQIKTGRERRGNVVFNTKSSTRRNGQRHEVGYNGQVEFFAVYDRSRDCVYMVPVDRCAASKAMLRVDKQKAISGPKCLMASDFLLKGMEMK